MCPQMKSMESCRVGKQKRIIVVEIQISALVFSLDVWGDLHGRINAVLTDEEQTTAATS